MNRKPPESRWSWSPHWLLATCIGAGLAPLAPGTVGSIPGLMLFWALWATGGAYAAAAGALILAVAGTWAADRTSTAAGEEDPPIIVIDETAGQMVSLLFLAPTLPVLGLGFVLFRLFDIIKPPPARQLERLPGGFGVMADDLAAGVYANLVLRGLIFCFPDLQGLS